MSTTLCKKYASPAWALLSLTGRKPVHSERMKAQNIITATSGKSIFLLYVEVG